MSMTLEQAQAIIASQQLELQLKDNQILELTKALNDCQQRVQGLQLEVKRLLKRLYGPKSEAFCEDPNQLVFDDLLASVLEQARDGLKESMNDGSDLIPSDPPNSGASPRNRSKHGRLNLQTLEDVLDCEDIIVDVEAEEKLCPETGEPMVEIGQEVTRKLEIIPGRIFIKRYLRPKFVSPQHPEVGVVLAQLPAFPIPKCKLGRGADGRHPGQ